MHLLVKWVITILRVFVGGVFAYSGWNKLSKPVQEFQYAIEAYQAFPSTVNLVAAYTVPWIELILGVFLILGYFRRKTSISLLCLTISFLTLLISTKIRGIEIANCGCFGEGVHLTVTQAIMVDTSLALALFFLTKFRDQFLEIDQLIKSHHVQS